MSPLLSRSRWSALLLLALVLFVSCVGSKARETTLSPATQSAWGAVAQDIARGLDHGLAHGDLTQEAALAIHESAAHLQDAIEAGTVSQADLISWRASLEGWAVVGIDARVAAGEITPGVAESLRETLVRLDEAIELLAKGGGA